MAEIALVKPPAGFTCKCVGRDISIADAWDKISKFDDIYLDSESNFLKWWNFGPEDIAGYSISTKDNENYYFPINMKRYFPNQVNLDPRLCARFLTELRERNKLFIYGNAKIDWHIIGPTLGVNLSNTRFRDILLLSHLVNPNGLHGVKTLGEQVVGPAARFADYMLREIKKSFGMTKKAGTDFDYRLVPLEVMVYYACADTWLTRLIDEWLALNPHLPAFADYIETEHEVCRGLYHTENRGIKIDQSYIEQKREEYEDLLIEDRAYIWYHAGERFNPESNPQMLNVLYDHLKLPPQYTTDKQGRTHLAADKVAMMILQDSHPVVPAVKKYRTDKKIGEYCDKIALNLDHNGRIHTNFNQFKENTADLRTGRLSSSDPINLENIPRSDTTIRRAFLPDDYFFFGDWSNQEGRLYAHYANERVYKDAFSRGEDSHARTCSFAFPEYTYEYIIEHKKDTEIDKYRQIAKRSFFRKLYGGGYKKGAIVLAEYGEPYDEERSRQIDNNILRGLPNFNTFCRKVVERAKERGYVYDVFDRRYVAKLNPRTGEPMFYALPNYLIQGTAGGMLKISIVRIAKEFGWDIFSNFIHDEIAFDRLPSRDIAPRLHEIQTTWPEVSVPMQVDCAWVEHGMSWADKKEIHDLNEWVAEGDKYLVA